MDHKTGLMLKGYEPEVHFNNDFVEVLTLKNKAEHKHVAYSLYKSVTNNHQDCPVLFVVGSLGDYVFNFGSAAGVCSTIYDNFQNLASIAQMSLAELASYNTCNSNRSSGMHIYQPKDVIKDLYVYLDHCGITAHVYSKIIKRPEHATWRRYFKRREDFVKAVAKAFDLEHGFDIDKLIDLNHGITLYMMLLVFDLYFDEGTSYYTLAQHFEGTPYDTLAQHLRFTGQRLGGESVLRLLQISVRKLKKVD